MPKTREQVIEAAQRRAGPAATQFIDWAGGELWRRAYQLAQRLGLDPAECEDVARATVHAAVKASSQAVKSAVRERAFRLGS